MIGTQIRASLTQDVASEDGDAVTPYIVPGTTTTTNVSVTCSKCGERYPGAGLGYHVCPDPEPLFGTTIGWIWRTLRGK
jgi:hypothetical protein